MLAKKFKLIVQNQRGKPIFFKNSDYFSIRGFFNQLDFSRFGLVVSRKIAKGAVKRNKIKRQIFDFIRQNGLYLKPGFDVLIITKPMAGKLDKKNLEGKLKELIMLVFNKK